MAAPPTLLRHGLLLTLQARWPDYPTTLAPDPAQLLACLRERTYALLVLDGTTLASAVLPELLQQVRRLRPRLPLLLLTGRRPPHLPSPADATRLRLLPRHATPAQVADAAATLLATATTLLATIPPPNAPPTPTRLSAAGFSARELEVLALVAADLCNEQIADRLCLSVRTVESHRRALLHKAEARTCVGLVVRALREGWVST